jgi:hypothetical protein
LKRNKDFDFYPFNLNSAVSGRKTAAADKEEAWFTALRNFINLDAVNFTAVKEDKVIQTQLAIIIASCLSTLDRSSAVQRQISDFLAYNMLADLLKRAEKKTVEMPADMKQWMAHGWVDVANTIAEQYAGTKAKKNDLILTGKSTIMGRIYDWTWLTGLRHLNANYFDKKKKEIMEIVFGKNAVMEN